MAEMGKPRWGDDIDSGWGDDIDSDDEEETGLDLTGVTVATPPTHTSRVDEAGIQILTSYQPAQNLSKQVWIKTTTKQRVDRYCTSESKGIEKRHEWKKFGTALEDEKEGIRTTVQCREDVSVEDPNANANLQDEEAAVLAKTIFKSLVIRQPRQKLESTAIGSFPITNSRLSKVGPVHEVSPKLTKPEPTNGVASGRSVRPYVPPSQRRRDASLPTTGYTTAAAAQNNIRVSNVSVNTTEADLQELFSYFGRVSHVYLAKTSNGESRGFAFITFLYPKDAATAMEKLQGYGYDHLILKLEWAAAARPGGTEYRSGYGKALAQDTKEKVSFASNLTK